MSFTLRTDASLAEVWGYLGDMTNLPGWDVGSRAVRRVGTLDDDTTSWEVQMAPVVPGTAPFSLVGESRRTETPSACYVSNDWRFSDGTHAASDGWGVDDDGARRFIWYTLYDTHLRVPRSCMPCAWLVFRASLSRLVARDKELLRGRFGTGMAL